MRRARVFAGMMACSLGALAWIVGVSAFGKASLPSSRSGTPTAFDRVHSDMAPFDAHAFRDFDLYSPGDSFEGHRLVGITRRLDPPISDHPLPLRANYVNFIYGRCEIPAGETGCVPPLQVQIWPACERNLSSYSLTPDGQPLPHRDMTVRGAPAAYFPDEDRLELYTGNVTIVLFGQSLDSLIRATGVLRGVNNRVTSDAGLPRPAAGATSGALACSG